MTSDLSSLVSSPDLWQHENEMTAVINTYIIGEDMMPHPIIKYVKVYSPGQLNYMRMKESMYRKHLKLFQYVKKLADDEIFTVYFPWINGGASYNGSDEMQVVKKKDIEAICIDKTGKVLFFQKKGPYREKGWRD